MTKGEAEFNEFTCDTLAACQTEQSSACGIAVTGRSSGEGMVKPTKFVSESDHMVVVCASCVSVCYLLPLKPL